MEGGGDLAELAERHGRALERAHSPRPAVYGCTRPTHPDSVWTGDGNPPGPESRQHTINHRTPVPDQPEGVNELAASILIAQESGTNTRRIHPHNGHHAGNLSAPWAGTRAAAGFRRHGIDSAAKPTQREYR